MKEPALEHQQGLDWTGNAVELPTIRKNSNGFTRPPFLRSHLCSSLLCLCQNTIRGIYVAFRVCMQRYHVVRGTRYDSNPGLLRIRKECHSRSPVTGHPAQSTKITCGRTCNESEWNHGRIAGQRSRGRWTCVKRALRVWLCKVKSSHLTSQHLRAYAGRDLPWVDVAPGLYNSQPQSLPGAGHDNGCCDL